MIPAPRSLFRLQAGAWGALALICLGTLGYAIVCDEDVPFIRRGDGPGWIMAPLPRTTDLIVVDPAAPPRRVFSKHFQARATDPGARLVGRALREARVELNGEPVALALRGAGWKQGFQADLAGRLRDGRNEIRVVVTNPGGPALLQIEIEKSDGDVVSDSSWRVALESVPSPPVFAEMATDIALHPESRQLPTPLEIPPRQAGLLLLIFALTTTLAWRKPDFLARVPRERWPRITLASLTLFWIALFAVKFAPMPLAVGFDAGGHLAYIEYLLELHALPTAAYGFSTYHPPLFYVLTSAWVELFGADAGTGAGRVVYRSLPFASGLANLWLTSSVARRLWPGQGLKPSLAIAAAGLLPMNLYMSAYVSNEPMLAAWVSAALALATAILFAQRIRVVAVISLTGLLGAALLTKFTALGVAPVIAFFVALRYWWLDGRSPGRALALFAAMAAGVAAIAGWFYLRNWMLFGDPLVWNLDIPGEASWWMRPGFHTAAWYSSFGEALSHPIFAGYASFWDGIYSTLWGDGLVGGMARASTRHGFWNDEFQLLTYPLALPATLAFGVGAIRLWLASFRGDSVAVRLVLSMLTSVLFLLAFSLGLISLRLAFYAQAKAFYLLCGILPLAIAWAEGMGAMDDWTRGGQSTWRRALHCAGVGWLASLAACIGLAHLG